MDNYNPAYFIYALKLREWESISNNSHIYFKNYNVLDKLFRNNNELFKIDTTDVQELEKLKAQIDFVDRFFTDAGIDPCLLLSTKENKINIPYHIEKKIYNLEVVYTNYLLYRKFKKLPVNLFELINLSYMLIPRINDEYILYNTYNKQQLIHQINSMNDGHMKMKLLELLTRNTINSKYYYDAVNKNYVLEKPIADSDDSDTDENELEQDIAHLTDEQRLEMGFPVKPKPTIVNTSDGPKIFDIIYNDKYDWLKTLKDTIEDVKLASVVKNVYLCRNNEYQCYQEWFRFFCFLIYSSFPMLTK